MKKRDTYLRFSGIFIILLLVCVPAVSAFTARLVSSTDVYNGDKVEIQLDGFNAGDTFQINMSSTDLETSGGKFALNNFQMPFAFGPGTPTTLLIGKNLDSSGLELDIQKNPSGSVTQIFYNLPATPPNYKITAKGAINAQTYSQVAIIAAPKSATDKIGIDFSIEGPVSTTGSNYLLTFTINNVNSGTLNIKVPDGGMNTNLNLKGTEGQAVETIVTVGGKTTIEYNIETTISSPVDATIKIPTGTSATKDGVTITTITNAPVTQAQIDEVTGGTNPSGAFFQVGGASIQCSPDGAVFDQDVTITFVLTEAQWNTALAQAGWNLNKITIKHFDADTKIWVDLTTTVTPSTRTITAVTRSFSIFAIFADTSAGPSPVSGGGDIGGPLVPAAPHALLAPPGIPATTVTLLHNEEGKVLADYTIETDPAAGFSSTFEISTGTKVTTSTGQPVGEISLTPLDPANVPDVSVAQGGLFSFSGLAVEGEPSGTQFSGGSATISFSLTPAQWADALGKVNGNTAAMTIQFYDIPSKTWVDVPTVVDPVTHTVSAHVTHFSTYALFYKITKEVTPQITSAAGQLLPTAAPTTGAPVTSPVRTMLAPPSTTQAPGLPGIVVIGVIGFIGLYVLKKKQ